MKIQTGAWMGMPLEPTLKGSTQNLVIFFVILLSGLMILSASLGYIKIGWLDTLKIVLSDLSANNGPVDDTKALYHTVVMDVRLPRILTCVAVWGALSVSGVLFQGILSAGISFLKYTANEQVSVIIFWLMGSFASKTWTNVITVFFALAVGFCIALFFSRDLKNINLEFKPGRFYSILDPNGCGKTTLMDLLTRQMAPGSGLILLDERPMSEYSRNELAKSISLVSQNHAVNFPFTVEEIVLMGRHPHISRFSSPNRKDMEQVESVVRLTGIEGLRHRDVTRLSAYRSNGRKRQDKKK